MSVTWKDRKRTSCIRWLTKVKDDVVTIEKKYVLVQVTSCAELIRDERQM